LKWLIEHSGKMFVLAGIYGAMNILSFVALQYIGAGEFTICAQLKILTTAAASVIYLGTSLTWTKWRALAALVLGCILVASPNFSAHGDSEASQRSAYEQLLGYAAVLTEVMLSGFASIYFEKVVKSTTEVVTIWERNFQLGFYSIIIYGSIMMYEGGAEGHVAWSNCSPLTFLVAFAGAGGGLLVAATLKYADSILKTLAAAGAIVLSTILGHVFLGGPLDTSIIIGSLATIISIANYTLDSTPTTSPSIAISGSLASLTPSREQKV
jgi:UDP-sugar transporter A1/2/3